MKTQNMLRSLSLFVLLAILLSFQITSVSAQPPAPVPISPADGSMIVMPTFSWQSSNEAEYYEVQVGPQSDPNTVYWTEQTANLTLTPNDANTFTNDQLYWRVRAYDNLNVAGAWSSKINFTKTITAPVLVSPTNASNIIHPVFEWQAVNGAAYYKVELSLVESFVAIEATYTTYNTSVTPVNTIAHGLHYWRVSGVDADGHVGQPSGYRTFTKVIDPPVLVLPAVDETISIPTMVWEAVDGAAYYKVELSLVETFNPIEATYTTYNTSVTPVDAIPYKTYYWRVSGVDADDHVGNSNWRKFILIAPSDASDLKPQLITPADTATITADPNFSWTRVVGADHYNLIVSTYADFHATYDSVLTDYNSYTPTIADSPDAYPNDTYYWKVEARTTGGSVIGTSGARSFTKQEGLPLLAPGDGAILYTDPTFQWNQIIGAHHYNLVVSEYADFHATYDSVLTDYNSYTPTIADSPDAYPNGTYYWKVEARTISGTVVATSEAYSVNKQESLPLVAPLDGATTVVDPTFQWNQIIGAHHYRLIVSTESNFSSTYDVVLTDYNCYTPFIGESPNPYANDTYYWKVEARTISGTVIVTSNGWTFTIGSGGSLYLPIITR